MNIWDLRAIVDNDVIDSLTLKDLLKGYKKPRDKITAFLKSGELVQVKRGLYLFGTKYKKNPYNILELSNLIYGPSAVSLEYALSYYGLIPERVETITAISPKKNKEYNTPVGRFTYKHIHPNKYSAGITLMEFDEARHVFIASPEKALCDLVLLSGRKVELSNLKEAEEYLLEDLRIDEMSLIQLKSRSLRKINDVYKNRSVEWLIYFLESIGEAKWTKD